MSSISIDAHELTDWEIYTLPMESPDAIHGWKKRRHNPGAGIPPRIIHAHHGLRHLSRHHKLGKGFVWVNGHNLGRVWDIGPQKSLYPPAPWLRVGENEVVDFDYTDPSQPTLRGLAGPLWSASKE